MQLYNNKSMGNVDALETLGVVMSNDGTANINVQKKKCRQAYYNLDNTGMPYPGLPINIQIYLYKYVCLPTLLFWMEIMFLSDKLIKKLESFQGSLMKRSLGLSKFSHHWKLLEALKIPKVSDSINNMTISL